MPALREGTPLKRGTFVIVSLLGRGGFGEVYLARQPRMNRDVAIKVLNPNLSDDPSVRARFQREALAAAALRHPHVLPVFDFDFDEEAGVYFLAMQYVPGGRTLKDRLGEPLDLEETARVLSGVAGALDAAHARGIIHRDVKPANVLIDGEHVMLADFGIAHLGEMTGITATGLAIGTPTYMSPEQAMGKPVGPAADQYSLAVMAFEMLTGRPPFLGDAMSLVLQHASQPPPTLSQFNPSIPPGAAAAVARALSKEPIHRFPTCGDFVRALLPVGGAADSAADATASLERAPSLTVAAGDDGLAIAARVPGASPAAPPDAEGAIPTARHPIDTHRRLAPVTAARPLPVPRLLAGAAALLIVALAAAIALRTVARGLGSGPPVEGGQESQAPAVAGLDLGPTAASFPGGGAPASGPKTRVDIDSNPKGALILIDGQVQTLTPRGFQLDPGEYQITLQLQSYEDHVERISVVEGQPRTISVALTPKPPAAVLEVAATAIGRDPYRDSFGFIRIETPTTTFRIQDDIHAVAYVRPASRGIRDLPFSMTARWQRASGPPIVRSVDYRIPKDSEEEYLHVCAPASAVDPQASNSPLTVEILADGEPVAAFEFRVSGGNLALRPPSPCDETTIRGPVAHTAATRTTEKASRAS